MRDISQALRRVRLASILGLVFLATPAFAFAASHHYTCADSGLVYAGASPTCVGSDVFTFTGGASSVRDGVSGIYLPPIDGTTYYISYTSTITGSGPYENPQVNGDNGSSRWGDWTAGTVSEVPMTNGANDPNSSFLFYVTTAGTISGLCIDDDGVSCSGGPAPAPYLWTNVPYQYAYCDKVAGGVCMEYSFVAASSSNATGSPPVVPYGGLSYREQLFVACVIISLLAFLVWPRLFRYDPRN